MFYPYTVSSGRTINGAFRNVNREDLVSYNIAIAVLNGWTNPHCGRLEYRVLTHQFKSDVLFCVVKKTAQVT